MTSRLLFALVLLAPACSKPGEPAPHTDTPGTADAPPPEPAAQDVVEPICAALLPTLGAWNSGLKRKQEIAALVAQDHVAPCDDRAPRDAQPADGSDEASYCRAAIGHEICRNGDGARRSIELWTRAFPESADAWLALAAWQLAPLNPEDSGLPYNASIAPAERLRVADAVLATLVHVERLRPDDPRVYDLIAVAYEQRMYARNVVDRPTTPEEKLEAKQALEDGQRVTAARQKLCKVQRLPSCRPTGPARELVFAPGDDEAQEVPEGNVPLSEP